MNKKITKGIVGALISFALILGMSTAAFASETVQMDEGGYAEFNGSSDVDYHVYSTYTVTIPAVINRDTGYTGNVDVTMDNIEEGYHVNAYISNLDDDACIVVTNQKGRTAKLRVDYNNGQMSCTAEGLIGTWYPADFNSEMTTASVDAHLIPEDLFMISSGSYTGAVCFKVECVPD